MVEVLGFGLIFIIFILPAFVFLGGLSYQSDKDKEKWEKIQRENEEYRRELEEIERYKNSAEYKRIQAAENKAKAEARKVKQERNEKIIKKAGDIATSSTTKTLIGRVVVEVIKKL